MARVDAEIEAEYFDAFLEEAVKSGRITAERADAIRAQVKSGDYSGLDQLWLDSYEEECGRRGLVRGAGRALAPGIHEPDRCDPERGRPEGCRRDGRGF